MPDADSGRISVDAADASRVFVTYRTTVDEQAEPCGGTRRGVVARLTASTGEIEWTAIVGSYTKGLIRGGSTIWLYNEFGDPDLRCTVQTRILGFAADAEDTEPLVALRSDARDGFPLGLAIASGTLLQQTWNELVDYRVG